MKVINPCGPTWDSIWKRMTHCWAFWVKLIKTFRHRVSSEGNIVFTGGVAKSPCMVAFLSEKLGRKVLIPENPQFIGAFGTALFAPELENTLIE